jgi:hypothetical protein
MYEDRGIERTRREGDGVARSSSPRSARARAADPPDHAGGPVFAHEAVDAQDRFETEDSSAPPDRAVRRSWEKAIPDVPTGGTGVVAHIGVGGGGAGCFGFRTGGGRMRAALRGGGSRASEAAVASALAYLARTQQADGGWPRGEDRKDGSSGERIESTGLALLAFLAGGHTEKAGAYRAHVARAVAFLSSRQSPEGEIGAGTAPDRLALRRHAIAGLALAEAYGMARTPRSALPAERAAGWTTALLRSDGPLSRRAPHEELTTVALAWSVAQLKSAAIAGLHVDGTGFVEAIAHLDALTIQDGPGAGSVRPGRGLEATPLSTVAGVACRQYLGWRLHDRLVSGAAAHVSTHTPDWRDGRPVDLEYCVFGSQAMFHLGGDHWRVWNDAVRDGLVGGQRRRADGADADGAWDPGVPTRCRASSTAMGALCLEVYYRYLPLYRRTHSRTPPRAPAAAGARRPPQAGDIGDHAVRRSEEIRRLREADTLEGAR